MIAIKYNIKKFFKSNISFRNKLLIYLLFYLSIITGFILNEDGLGGAQHDYDYHLKLISNDNFSIKFFIENARNSPVFYLITFKILKFLPTEVFRLLNSLTSILISYIFYLCLNLKYSKINKNYLFILSLLFFLSPTVRSLSIWPYPLQYALIFFILSIYFFLKAKNAEYGHSIIYVYINIISLSLSAYIYPTFATFSIFYLYHFYKKYNFTLIKKFIILNLVLATPALFFIYLYGFYFFNVPGANINFLENINFANKIMIICTILSFFLIPFLKKENFINSFKKFSFIYLILFIFSVLLIKFFNYQFTNYYGGGVFFKLSNYIFNNNILFYIIFFISLIIFYNFFSLTLGNFFIFLCLILYNLQYTIYLKYYDPLVFLIIIFLARLRNEIVIKDVLLKSYIFYFFYIIMILTKFYLIKFNII